MVRSPLPGGNGEGGAQAAGGGPFGLPGFRDLGLRLLEAGYEPLPLRRATKVPAVPRWSRVTIDVAQVEHWARDHPDGGVGLRSGRLVGLDIDLLDPDLAWSVADLASRRLTPSSRSRLAVQVPTRPKPWEPHIIPDAESE